MYSVICPVSKHIYWIHVHTYKAGPIQAAGKHHLAMFETVGKHISYKHPRYI